MVKNEIVLVYPYSEALWGGVGALRLFSWMAYLIISKLNFTENQAIHHPAIKTFHETKKEKGFADRPFQNPGIAKKKGGWSIPIFVVDLNFNMYSLQSPVDKKEDICPPKKMS